MFSPSKMWNGFKNYIYKNYGENPGSMLVHTGVLGWILSSMAVSVEYWPLEATANFM